jgi:hypothetical protein
MVTLHLPGELYAEEAHRAARQAVYGLVGHWPAWYTVESGEKSGLHVHIVTAAELESDLPDGVNVRSVWSLRGVLAYLSKPKDSRAARSNHRRTLSLNAVLAASEDHLGKQAARRAAGHCRLPTASGSVNVPRRSSRPEAPPLLLVLACLLELVTTAAVLAFLVQSQSRAKRQAAAVHIRAHCAAVLSRREAVQRRAAVPVQRGHSARLKRLPGLPVALRSQRLNLIGHARPPPISWPRSR